MKAINLEKLGQNPVSFYLALEQYVLNNMDGDVFFLWNIPPSIVIGRNQLMQSEINAEFIRQQGIKVYRRPSGGGAIYADTGCFMYSFVTRERNRDVIYQTYLSKLLLTLRELGLDVSFSGRNDLMFMSKKFSGTAILQAKEGSVLHGTLLYDTNLEDLVQALTVDASKIISKGIKSVSERVINLKPYLSLSKEGLMDFLLEHICPEKLELTDAELAKVRAIEKKFASDEWNIGQHPRFSFHNKQRFPFGSMEVYLLIRNNRIREISLKGDFFQKQNLDGLYEQFRNVTFDQDSILKVLQANPLSEYIYDATSESLMELIFKEERE